MGKQRHANRNNKRKGKNKDKFTDRVARGEEQIQADNNAKYEEYRLGGFEPTPAQKDIIVSMCQNDLTLVQGSSGTGKSSTVIWQGLHDLKRGYYRKILFVKTADESADDNIGFLPNGLSDKLAVHFESMRSIFHSFMSKEKLAMEEKHERIVFNIPNFIKGMTFDNTLIIVDEAQSISPKILKLILERTGKDSRVVVMGDKAQCYSSKKRVNGLTDLVSKVTRENYYGTLVSTEPLMGYVELPASENMRSALSRRIVEIYEEGE